MKKILLDANPIVPYLVLGKISGIGRTCLELVQALDNLRDKLPFKLELYTQNLKGVSANQLNTSFKSQHVYLRNTETGRIWSKRLGLREILSGYDLQHITHNFEIVRDPSRCIVTVHDVMFFSYPEAKFNPDENRKNVPSFARKARHIITISENSKREIMEYMNVPEEKITVIPWGVNHGLLYPHSPAPNSYTEGAPYFIAVSCSDGRKNTVSVVRAFEKFARNHPSHHLIIVWASPSAEVRKLAALPHVKGRIHFTSNLSNEDLAELYAGATASFFPSLYEGFGLPIIESMACGVPCVTCRNSSLQEVGGTAAIYVEPLDIDTMAREMENFENKTYNIEELSKKCTDQASLFTWYKCAKATIEVYKRSLS